MKRPVVVLRAIRSGTPADVLGGELVLPGSSEASAYQRLAREHPRCWIERSECPSRVAAERLLGLDPVLPEWLEALGFLLLWVFLAVVAIGLGLWVGWLRR